MGNTCDKQPFGYSPSKEANQHDLRSRQSSSRVFSFRDSSQLNESYLQDSNFHGNFLNANQYDSIDVNDKEAFILTHLSRNQPLKGLVQPPDSMKCERMNNLSAPASKVFQQKKSFIQEFTTLQEAQSLSLARDDESQMQIAPAFSEYSQKLDSVSGPKTKDVLPSYGPLFYNMENSTYKGQYKNCERWGYGECIYLDGSGYMGMWEQDKRQGKGVFVIKTGEYLMANFLNDVPHGEGTLH